jgi:bacterioferritin-associated ferredoxin
MIVCICEGISDRTIQARIDAGDRTVRQLGRSCGAGSDCGSCSTHLRELLDRRLDMRRLKKLEPAAAK